MSTTPSFRLPFTLPNDVHPAVRDAFRILFNGLTNHEQAFAEVKQQINAVSTPATPVAAKATVTGPQSGNVTNQTTQASYALQDSDYGAAVALSNAAGGALTNGLVSTPFYCRVMNIGSGAFTFTPNSGLVYSSAAPSGAATYTHAAGTTVSYYFDGLNWWVG